MSYSEINRWFFQIPLEDVKTTKKDTTADNCCFLCGKQIKGSAKYVVHYLNDGTLASCDWDMQESQGFFPIGSECKSKLPNNFTSPA